MRNGRFALGWKRATIVLGVVFVPGFFVVFVAWPRVVDVFDARPPGTVVAGVVEPVAGVV